ncbi:MAG TPA: hypothetical protein VEC14_11575 [Reyranellaceae bacterium]|nr:hypothetical protein [Reyranellaceae bacterium]
MTLLKPEAGLVVSYSYLWHVEHVKGQEEGRKDRPCAIVLVVADGKSARQRVLLLPVTHSAPTDSDSAVEIPTVVKRRLGLDSQRSWIVLSEWNETLWPSPDLRRTSRRKAASIAYGFLPPRFFNHVRERFLAVVRERKARRVKRAQ